MAMPRPAAIAIAILAGIMAFTAARAFPDRLSRKMPDLEVYWTAAARAHTTAEPLYRPEDGHYQFKDPPCLRRADRAPCGACAALESAKSGRRFAAIPPLWTLVASRCSHPACPSAERAASSVAGMTATLVVMLKFYGHELILGQMNALFAVIVVFAVVALRFGREAIAGGLLALAIVVKPYAVLFAPWILARRRAASIAALGLGTLALLALPAAVYGVAGDIELHVAWWRTVTESTAPNLTNADNVSIAAMWAKWMGIGGTATLLSIVSSAALLAAAAFVFLRRRASRFPEGLEAALLLTCIPLLSPQGWDYVFLCRDARGHVRAQLLQGPSAADAPRRGGCARADRLHAVRHHGTRGVFDVHDAVHHHGLFLRRCRSARDDPARGRLILSRHDPRDRRSVPRDPVHDRFSAAR